MESRIVLSKCPVCNKTVSVYVMEDIVHNSKKHLNPFIFQHCENNIITYIDHDFKARGSEIVFNVLNNQRKGSELEKLHAKPIVSS